MYVRSVFVDQKQKVWVGTDGGGLFRLETNGFQAAPGTEVVNSHVSAIFQDRKGLLWVGTRNGLACWDEHQWKIFTTADGLSTNAVQAIADDSQGNLWIGTSGGGLNCLREGRFTSFTTTNGLPNNDISFLYVDPEEVVWVATAGGLGRFDHGKWTRYTKNEGLIKNSIFYLIEDNNGFLWIGSTAGLMRVEKKALNDFANGSRKAPRFRAYGQSDGLPTGECTSGSQPAACRTRAGLLWFPTIKGLASLDSALLNPNTNPPPVLIESVRIDGQLQTPTTLRAPPPRSVIIPAGKESLDIDYTSLNLSAPHKGRFRYRLDPYESGWTERPGDVRTAHYSKLPPGHFTFQVVACNEDEVFNTVGSTLAVTVLPPFWRTGWFLTLSTVCLLGMIVGSVHFISTQKLHRQLETLRQQEALEKERARIARDLHDQLGANLTQVALLGELAETDKNIPEEVESHAQQICQTARDTTRALDEIVWTVNPSNDTLDGLINYVCKYAQEYLAVAGLRYRLDVPGQLPATPISPELRHNVFLASKEAITNVVRHAKATAASIRLRLEPNRFTLEIQDDGRGVGGMDQKAAQLRNGLRNMRKRMEDVGGEFSISSIPEGGAVVRLSAPLENGRNPITPSGSSLNPKDQPRH
jgi:signal transduction histidine kinase